MNRLKDVFDDIVQDAPPIGDVAARAMSRARRRRWINWGGSMTAAGLAVAGVTAIALVVAGLPGAAPPSVPQDGEPADDPTQATTVAGESVLDHQPIQLPLTTPDAMPARGVGQVALAYTLDCADAPSRGECASWRVLTVDGKHWRVADAIRADVTNIRGQAEVKQWLQPSGLAVSPDGRKLAYFREDGSFGIRDLGDGSFRVAFHEKDVRIPWDVVSIMWSQDGKRVAVSYPFSGVEIAAAKLVDVASLRVVELPAACCVLGLAAGDGAATLYDVDASANEPNWSQLLVLGPDAVLQSKVPFDQPIDLTDDIVRRYQWSRLSPDGRSIIGLVDEDQERPKDRSDPHANTYQPDPQLEVVTISALSGEITARHRVTSGLRGKGYTKVLGWSSGSELLAADLTGGSYKDVVADDPAYAGGDLYAVNVRTGATRPAVTFGPLKPTLLSVAANLVE